jgi:hypothetical protein
MKIVTQAEDSRKMDRPFASVLDTQAPEIQEAFQFVLVTAKTTMATA